MRYSLKSYDAHGTYRIYVYKFLGVIFSCISLGTLASLFTFNSHDNSWLYFSSVEAQLHNSMGYLGAHYAAALFYFFGLIAYSFIPFFLFIGYCLFFDLYDEEYDRIWLSPLTILTLSFIARFHMSTYTIYQGGGIVGDFLYTHIKMPLDSTTFLCISYVILFTQGIVLARSSLYRVVMHCYAIIKYIIAYRNIWLTPIIALVKYVVSYTYYVARRFVIFAYKFFFKKESAQNTVVDVDDYNHEVIEEELSEEKNNAYIKSSRMIAVKKYRLPDNGIFLKSDKQQQNSVTSEHTYLAKTLEEKLACFNVSGKVTKIKPGPVITLFEYQPDIDSKVSKILALEHDLALALEAISVRIVAPIPGTSRVGFEVSNKERKSVKMGDIVRSSLFSQTTYSLPLILGQDTSGENILVDLIDMPHLLVAGSTGSGKSVALNVMLTSLLCKLTPDQLRLIIIDPKRLEFAAYQDIAHLLFPIVTDARRAAPVAQWLVKTMEDRYEFMARKGVKNILDYKRVCEKNGEVDELPFIVFIIDELADLMMVAGKDIETNIARLAQMARAAGIHLIIATQRPSVDVITGVIKVNFPSRISFRVSSKIDSRTIIDTGGAEVLLGKGDMLFMHASSARIKRVHGAYISDSEIALIVDHIRRQKKVEYIDLQEAIAAYEHNQQEQEYDEILPEVLRFIAQVDEISISLLQRKFKIGYNRSAALIEQLERQGKILPAQGGKMRKVIK